MKAVTEAYIAPLGPISANTRMLCCACSVFVLCLCDVCCVSFVSECVCDVSVVVIVLCLFLSLRVGAACMLVS